MLRRTVRSCKITVSTWVRNKPSGLPIFCSPDRSYPQAVDGMDNPPCGGKTAAVEEGQSSWIDSAACRRMGNCVLFPNVPKWRSKLREHSRHFQWSGSAGSATTSAAHRGWCGPRKSGRRVSCPWEGTNVCQHERFPCASMQGYFLRAPITHRYSPAICSSTGRCRPAGRTPHV